VYLVDGVEGDAADSMQPSLSPDKKWLAIAPIGDDGAAGGLILVDLTTPERKMTRIPIPPPKAPRQR